MMAGKRPAGRHLAVQAGALGRPRELMGQGVAVYLQVVGVWSVSFTVCVG